jgi:hypothetical protein
MPLPLLSRLPPHSRSPPVAKAPLRAAWRLTHAQVVRLLFAFAALVDVAFVADGAGDDAAGRGVERALLSLLRRLGMKVATFCDAILKYANQNAIQQNCRTVTGECGCRHHDQSTRRPSSDNQEWESERESVSHSELLPRASSNGIGGLASRLVMTATAAAPTALLRSSRDATHARAVTPPTSIGARCTTLTSMLPPWSSTVPSSVPSATAARPLLLLLLLLLRALASAIVRAGRALRLAYCASCMALAVREEGSIS